MGPPRSLGPSVLPTPWRQTEAAGQQARLTLNMNPGGRSRRPAPLPPSTVPFTVAEKVSTTTAGRELWGEGAQVSEGGEWVPEGGAARAEKGVSVPNARPACFQVPHQEP